MKKEFLQTETKTSLKQVPGLDFQDKSGGYFDSGARLHIRAQERGKSSARALSGLRRACETVTRGQLVLQFHCLHAPRCLRYKWVSCFLTKTSKRPQTLPVVVVIHKHSDAP